MKTALSKKTLLFFLLALAAFPLFAQIPNQMQNLADTLYEDVFNSNLIRVILAILLCGSALAYAFNKDNEKMKRNALTLIIASAILMSAQQIVKMIYDAGGN